MSYPRKIWGFAHKDCNINIKLNHKIPVVFLQPKNYDSHLMMQELGKFSLKMNVILNGLEKYKSFSINNKLIFINNFPFASSSLESLVKNLSKDDFKYMCQEFNINVLDLIKQERFYPYEYMRFFLTNLKNSYKAKKIFIVLWLGKILLTKNITCT